MDSQFVNYCLGCDWSASTEQYSRQELSALVIEHARSTSHHVNGKRLRGDQDERDRDHDLDREADYRRKKDARSVTEDSGQDLDLAHEEGSNTCRPGSHVGDSDPSTASSDNEGADLRRPEDSSSTFTRGDFEVALHRLVRRGYRSRVSIRGGYDVRSPEQELPDYTIEVSELDD